MRLTTLSRKLGITRDQLIEFLISKNIQVPEGVNAKISEDEAALAIAHFTPEPIEEDEEEIQNETSDSVAVIESEVELNLKEQSKEEPHLEDAPVTETVLQDEEPQITPDTESVPRPEEDESLEEFVAREDVDLIKAKKIKLEGVKVLGKIELPKPPEPKPKEESKEEEKEKKPEEQKPKGLYGDYLEKKKRPYDSQRKKRKPRKELSYTEKQKREQDRYEREKQKKIKADKKRKEEYYKQKVQAKKQIEIKEPPVKKEVKIKKAKPSVEKVQAQKPKNVISRLWGWLNGEYDKF